MHHVKQKEDMDESKIKRVIEIDQSLKNLDQLSEKIKAYTFILINNIEVNKFDALDFKRVITEEIEKKKNEYHNELKYI